MTSKHNIKSLFYNTIFATTFALSLVGCSQLELASHFGKKLKDTSSNSVGLYKVGNPYTVAGEKYYPAVDYDYNETGIASWYGPSFHGKSTANGEIYDQTELTAAHKTLPLPSIVRITNLENGKSLIVRVNDRGPYSHGRIIDLSERSAELLGYKNKGTAKVRVQVLEAESKKIALAAQKGINTKGMEVPMNHPSYTTPNTQTASANNNAVYNNSSFTKKEQIPGHINHGNFYPDPVVSNYPVYKQQIYVQTGAFSNKNAAMKYASSLEQYGKANVSSVTIKGDTYYRVRIPAPDVAAADKLLDNLTRNEHIEAIIVVD